MRSAWELCWLIGSHLRLCLTIRMPWMVKAPAQIHPKASHSKYGEHQSRGVDYPRSICAQESPAVRILEYPLQRDAGCERALHCGVSGGWRESGAALPYPARSDE